MSATRNGLLPLIIFCDKYMRQCWYFNLMTDIEISVTLFFYAKYHSSLSLLFFFLKIIIWAVFGFYSMFLVYLLLYKKVWVSDGNYFHSWDIIDISLYISKITDLQRCEYSNFIYKTCSVGILFCLLILIREYMVD